MRISNLSQIQVLLQVSPTQEAELALGQPAFLRDISVPGRVTRIALQTDPETRLLEVEVTFPGRVARTSSRQGEGSETPGANAVLPGALATVEIVVGTRESTLQIPPAALHNGSVWVVDDQDRAERRPVVIGLRARDRLEILQGLASGDRVVTAGASLLSEGTRVRIVGG